MGNFSQGAHWKGFDVLIAAWARIQGLFPHAELIMVGGGDDTPWREMARSLNCHDTIRWAGATDHPATFYREAGVFVLPSRVEGMSNALLEAMSWGLPCAVSDIPGNAALIRHGENGLLVPVGNAQALACSVCRLLHRRDLRERLGASARRTVETRHSIQGVSRQMGALYRSLVPPRAATTCRPYL